MLCEYSWPLCTVRFCSHLIFYVLYMFEGRENDESILNSDTGILWFSTLSHFSLWFFFIFKILIFLFKCYSYKKMYIFKNCECYMMLARNKGKKSFIDLFTSVTLFMPFVVKHYEFKLLSSTTLNIWDQYWIHDKDLMLQYFGSTFYWVKQYVCRALGNTLQSTKGRNKKQITLMHYKQVSVAMICFLNTSPSLLTTL